MERLTMRDVGGRAFWVSPQSPGGGYRLTEDAQDQKRLDRLAAYEDTGLEPDEVLTGKDQAEIACAMNLLKEYQALGPIDHLRELAQAEKDGRLVVLPCKVGDTVYEANNRGFISTYKVISIHISDCSMLVGWELIDGIYSNLNGFGISALGKTVFLTRTEAEAALKKREFVCEIDAAADAMEILLAERDAAVEELRGRCWVCAHGKPWEQAGPLSKLIGCEHLSELGVLARGGGKCKCPHWKWRGPQSAVPESGTGGG